jgi:hypothetical protein
LAIPAEEGCTLILTPGEQQCKVDGDCAARGFAGGVCMAGVCEMPAVDPVWGCLGHLMPPPNPDPSVKITFSERLAYESDETAVTMATVDICAKYDLNCTQMDPNYPKGIVPGANGMVMLSLPQGFDGFIRISGMDVMDSRVFVGLPLFKPPTVQEVRLLRPNEYQLLVAYAKQMVDLTKGTAIVLAEDCSGMAASGISFKCPNADMQSALFYLINQVPQAPPTSTTTDSAGFGGFLNLPVGPAVVQAIRASDQTLIGQSSFDVLANTLSYVLVAPTPM